MASANGDRRAERILVRLAALADRIDREQRVVDKLRRQRAQLFLAGTELGLESTEMAPAARVTSAYCRKAMNRAKAPQEEKGSSSRG